MNSFPRFQINLAEEFPRLHHAPIVEAVLQINAPPLKPFQQSELKDLLSKRFEGYIRCRWDRRGRYKTWALNFAFRRFAFQWSRRI